MKEKSSGEKAGKGIRNVALAAGALGLFFAPEIVIPSIVLAASGEIFSKQFEHQKEA